MDIDIPLLKWQRQVFADKSFVRVCICGRGSGKTDLLGLETFASILKGDSVIIAAPTLRQANNTLLRAKAFAIKAGFDIFGKKYHHRLGRSKNNLKKGNILLCCDIRPDFVRGEEANKVIIDEAAFCSEYFYKDVLYHCARKNSFDNSPPSIIMGTTPKGTENWVSQKFINAAESKNTSAFHATYLDNHYTNKAWKETLLEEYAGRDEMVMRRELHGEILDYVENSPFSQFLKNIIYEENWEPTNEPVRVGVDLALGGDFTAVAVRKGNRLLALLKAKTSQSQLQEFVKKAINAAGYERADVLYYDSSGQGEFAHSLLVPLANRCIAVNFGLKATDRRCVNLRAQCYIGLLDKMREGITHGSQCKQLKNELIQDLLAVKPTPDESNQGRFGIVKKEAIKKEINRSPDVGDAVALAFINYNPPDFAKAAANLRGLRA